MAILSQTEKQVSQLWMMCWRFSCGRHVIEICLRFASSPNLLTNKLSEHRLFEFYHDVFNKRIYFDFFAKFISYRVAKGLNHYLDDTELRRLHNMRIIS